MARNAPPSTPAAPLNTVPLTTASLNTAPLKAAPFNAPLSATPLNAAQLLARFAVYGRFYEKPIAGVPEQLRDRLEIAPPHMALADVVAQQPDLLVIMMNPGASRPLDALWDSRSAGFTATQPDRTQYQIMQLLLAAQALGLPWQHARVLNLSDLRTAKSALFLQKLQDYAADDSHSLFSAPRSAQCQALFAHLPTPVLCAWGLSPHFAPLAERALAAAAGHPVLGLPTQGSAYRHPLPQRYDLQLAWLASMVQQVAHYQKIQKIQAHSRHL
jgi:hypothetical protein